MGFLKVHIHSMYITRAGTHKRSDMRTLQRLCTVINAPRRSLKIESNQVKCCEGPQEKEQV